MGAGRPVGQSWKQDAGGSWRLRCSSEESHDTYCLHALPCYYFSFARTNRLATRRAGLSMGPCWRFNWSWDLVSLRRIINSPRPDGAKLTTFSEITFATISRFSSVVNGDSGIT